MRVTVNLPEITVRADFYKLKLRRGTEPAINVTAFLLHWNYGRRSPCYIRMMSAMILSFGYGTDSPEYRTIVVSPVIKNIVIKMKR